MLPEFHQSSELYQSTNQLHQVNRQSGIRQDDIKDPITARKVLKADREKLRRDRLNEQFSELGSALDPDRPKNDKATILGDAVQILQDLTAEVKHLKSEHASLLDESRDLQNEKVELREEKATLKAEIEQLQSQLQQRVRAMLSWTGIDPAMIMGAPSFPYPVPVPHPGSSVAPDSHSTPSPGQVLTPLMAPPFIPIPVPGVTIPMHPSLHAYPIFGNRNTNGSNPYVAFASYPPQVNFHSHVERPSAQYPSPAQPLPECLVQRKPPQGSKISPIRPHGRVVRADTADTAVSAQAPSQAFQCQEVGMLKASDLSNGRLPCNVTVSSLNQSSSRRNHPDITFTNLQLQTPSSYATISQCHSNHSSQTSEQQGQMQDANSNVKQGNSSMCSTGGVSADLKSVQKAVIRGSSPSQSVQDAASSSFGDDCSTKSSRNSTKEKK
eukprot:Gb_05307 [translate_table: standard]